MHIAPKPFPRLHIRRIGQTTERNFPRWFLFLAVGIVASFVCGDVFAQLRGPKINKESQVQPTTRPTIIYVSDFAIDSNDFATERRI
jgi:hypothetical protein